MNLPQFLKMIDETTSKMTKEELAESIHHIARTLPEERRDWLVSMLSDDYIEETGTEETVPDDLYEELAKIISGEYRLDSEYNEESGTIGMPLTSRISSLKTTTTCFLSLKTPARSCTGSLPARSTNKPAVSVIFC